MTAKRDRFLNGCLVLADLGPALLLGSRDLAGLCFALSYLGASHLFQLHDSRATPRRDTRLLAAGLAAGLSWALIRLAAMAGLPWQAPDLLLLALLVASGQLLREVLALAIRLGARPVVILGCGPRALALARSLRRSPYSDMLLLGFVTPSKRGLLGLPAWDRVPEGARALDSTMIVRSAATSEDPQSQDIALGDLSFRRAEGPGDGVSSALKRGIDLILVLSSLAFTLPIFVLLFVLNRAVQGSPAIHRQRRITRGGKPFTIYKLRSMPLDAEPGDQPVWPAAEDLRITPMGKILRRSWLDELPQLWNVLKGDLALVGPRPERPEFVQVFALYLPRYQLRHRSRAGITGLAQVRGFVGNTSLRKRLVSDLQYLENWSPWLDLAVLGRTLCQILIRQKRQRFDYRPGDEGPIP